MLVVMMVSMTVVSFKSEICEKQILIFTQSSEVLRIDEGWGSKTLTEKISSVCDEKLRQPHAIASMNSIRISIE